MKPASGHSSSPAQLLNNFLIYSASLPCELDGGAKIDRVLNKSGFAPHRRRRRVCVGGGNELCSTVFSSLLQIPSMGNQLGARDSRSLKDGASVCHALLFFYPGSWNLHGEQHAATFHGIKGTVTLAGELPPPPPPPQSPSLPLFFSWHLIKSSVSLARADPAVTPL